MRVQNYLTSLYILMNNAWRRPSAPATLLCAVLLLLAGGTSSN
jgi:hypothetical protein